MELFVAGATERWAADLVGGNFEVFAYYYQIFSKFIAYQIEQKESEVFDDLIKMNESYFEGCRKVNR